MIKQILAFIAVFILGIAAASIIPAVASPDEFQTPVYDGGYEYKDTSMLTQLFGVGSVVPEKNSPMDRISESQITVTKSGVEIDLKDAIWATFTDTNSMDPVLDEGANAIEVPPKSNEDLEVGDIVAYESEYADGIIIHRIVHKDMDEKGQYYILKGDNNPTSDPGKVRFEQIKYVVVAIIY